MVEENDGEVSGNPFWSLKWGSTSTSLTSDDSDEPFFSEKDFEKHSVTHKKFLLSLYGYSYNEIITELPEDSSKTGEPSKRKSQEAKEKFSSLSSVEQQLYLQLLHKYSERICNNPAAEEKKEIQKLGELHVKVVHEQGEVIQHLKENSRKLNYNHIHPEALRYIQQLLTKKLEQSLTYPQHYNFDKDIQFVSSDDGHDEDSSFSFQKTILELGRVPRLVLPSFQKPCVLPLDYEKINKRFPLPVTGANLHSSKNPVSQDSVSKTLAEKYHADFVFSSSSLKTLLDNNPPEYDREWELPAVVEEITDSTGCRKVVYLDKAIPRSKLTGRERNYIYHKYAVKVQCSHFNPSRTKPGRPSDSTPKAATLQHLEDRTLSVVDTDLFGDTSNNMMELETFGTSTNATAFQWSGFHKPEIVESSTVADENKKKIELESPASPDPEDNPELASTPMKVVNVNSSLDSSADADCLNIFQKPLIPLKKPKLDVNSTCKSNDSDSDALVIDLDDTVKNAAESALNEETEKLYMENESSPRRSPRKRSLQSKTLPEINSISSPKRSLKSKGAEAGTSMVLRSKKKDVEPIQEKSRTPAEVSEDDAKEVVVAQNSDESDEAIDKKHHHEEATQQVKDSSVSHETLSVLDRTGNLSCHKEKEGEPSAADDCIDVNNPLNIANKKVENPLESILQLQEELLKTHISNVDVSLKSTDCQTEKASQYPIPDPTDNAAYNLCMLGKWNLLIRQQVNSLKLPSGNPCFLYPKLEYQAEYGGELNSKSDIIRQWSSLIVQRNSEILRVRINAYTSNILMCENVTLAAIIEKNKTRFQPEILLKQMASVLKSLQRLPSGQYILLHKKSDPKISVYKTTDNSKRGAFDFHILLQQRQMEVNDGLNTCNDASCWLPIDTEVLLPSLLKQQRVPATYPPQASSQLQGDRKKKRKRPSNHTRKKF